MPKSGVDASIVIAAHNEEAVIARTLEAIRPLELELGLDVVVVCNGCVDRTADVARTTGVGRVLELSQPSKVEALNAADEAVESFPRIYLDADIEVPVAALESTIRELRAGAIAARPPLVYDVAGASYFVRRYYRARQSFPSVMCHLWGAGLYGLSEEGRRRFHQFPDITGDDLYVDRLFSREERRIVDCPPVLVRVPSSMWALLRMLSRVYTGKRELEVEPISEDRLLLDMISYAKTSPVAAADVAIYLMIASIGRLRAKVSRDRWAQGR